MFFLKRSRVNSMSLILWIYLFRSAHLSHDGGAAAAGLPRTVANAANPTMHNISLPFTSVSPLLCSLQCETRIPVSEETGQVAIAPGVRVARIEFDGTVEGGDGLAVL